MHSETGCSALMVAAGQGFLPQVQQLLSMGADINMKAANGWYDNVEQNGFALHLHLRNISSFLL